MAARSTWRGFLKISLVNIPIRVFPATESAAAISFNQLHQECQTRIQQKRWCAKCDREVPNSEIVKGHEFEKGRYVVLSDDDFDAVRPDSTRVIDLVQFANAGELDPMFVDRTYYLAPEPIGQDAFAVMREGMKGKIGVGKLALYGREYLVAVRPLERGLALHTLHHAAEIRSIDAIDELVAVPATMDPRQTKLARQLVQTFNAPLDLSTFSDAYVEGLQKLIADKIAGREVVGAPAAAAPRVVNLAEALRQSLETLQRTKKKTPAKASPAKKGRGKTAA
jgi:DNA end-binding protein Ku